MGALVRFVAVIAVAAMGMLGTAVAVAPQAHRLFTASHGKAEPIDLHPLAERSLMFDRGGGLMATLHAEQNRAPVALAEVPQHVIDVILAVEDEYFYEHDGVNLRATFRALFANVESGQIEQGGSTITMQLVKNALLTPEQDLSRKTQEAVLARRLEEVMSKDEILERYLNTIYFGTGAYGVQAAAEVYFGRGVAELDIGQAALLASLIRSPANYDPFRNPELALERRNLALQRLVDVGKLSSDEAGLWAFQPLPTQPLLPPPVLDYFAEEVKLQLLRDPAFGLGDTPTQRYNALFGGGLRIHTTFDPTLQQQALDARTEILPGENGTFTVNGLLQGEPERRDHVGTASVVTVDPATGAILTMVGGPGFQNYQFNIATADPGRQTGSSFKMFVLLALLENGYVPDDNISGSSPCRFDNPAGIPDPYEAQNFEGSAGGTGTITQQTLRSSNCAYLRLGQIVGLDKVIDMAHRLGVTTPLCAHLSLPLGAESVSPLQMAAAYGTIANDGIYNAPFYVERIEDRLGNVIFQHQAAGTRAMSEQTARLATRILEQNVESGTGTRARLPDQVAAGKTGTAQNSADAWFVGFTPQFATAVWMGVPEGQVPLRNVGGITVTGGSYPARIWGTYMSAALDGVEPVDFIPPDATRPGRALRLEGELPPPGSTSRSSSSSSNRTSSPPTTSPRQQAPAPSTQEAPTATLPPGRPRRPTPPAPPNPP
ncbi:penicillin-binding protein 1A [soil metagenome]